MRLHRRACLLAVLVACARSPGQSLERPELPEIAAFRAALADPAQHPLRKGLELDEARLKESVARFRDEHRELLARTFADSLAALPAGSVPADGYGVVAETAAETAAGLAESTGFVYALNPDATHLSRMAISMFAPVLAREADMSLASIGSWLGFFASAAPAVRRCEAAADRAVVCVDYGGLDVFVVSLASQGSAWAVRSVSWRQRGRVSR